MITTLTTRTEELERELTRVQALAKINPLSYAKSIANRKDAKDKESLILLTNELEQLNSRMETQEEEFKRTNTFLKQEMNSLLTENQRMRDFIENETETGPQFLRSLHSPDDANSTCSPASPSHGRSNDLHDECDIGRSSSLAGASQFSLIAERERLNKQLLDVQHELKRTQAERQALQERLTQVSAEHLALKTRAAETAELSDVRKSTIDDMKSHIEESQAKYESELASIRDKMSSEKLDHEAVAARLQQQLSELMPLQSRLTEASSQLAEASETIKRLQEQADEQTAQVAITKQYFEAQLAEAAREHESQMLLLQETTGSEIQDLKERLANADRVSVDRGAALDIGRRAIDA